MLAACPLSIGKFVLVRLLERPPVIRVEGLSAEMEQVRLRGDCFRGYAGITEACRIRGYRLFLFSAIAGDETVNAHTGGGCAGGQARSTQDLPTIDRHLLKLPQRSGPVYGIIFDVLARTRLAGVFGP